MSKPNYVLTLDAFRILAAELPLDVTVEMKYDSVTQTTYLFLGKKVFWDSHRGFMPYMEKLSWMVRQHRLHKLEGLIAKELEMFRELAKEHGKMQEYLEAMSKFTLLGGVKE